MKITKKKLTIKKKATPKIEKKIKSTGKYARTNIKL